MSGSSGPSARDEGLLIVTSSHADTNTTASGGGSPSAISRNAVAPARLPPAESPAVAIRDGSPPIDAAFARSQRNAAMQSSSAAG
jgi:hypothetical protein